MAGGGKEASFEADVADVCDAARARARQVAACWGSLPAEVEKSPRVEVSRARIHGAAETPKRPRLLVLGPHARACFQGPSLNSQARAGISGFLLANRDMAD